MLQKQSSVGYLKSTKINSQAKDKSFQFKRRIRRQYNPDDINIAKLFLAIREHRTGNPQLDKTNAIKELLTQVDNINDTDYNDNGNTPLHVAVSKRHLDIVKLLLSTRDINPKAKNNRGQTPLDIINEDLNSKSKTSLDQDIIQELQGASSLKRENTGENKPEVGSPKKLRISSIKKKEPEGTKIEEGDPRTYPASGLKHTLHGNIYQLKLLMLFLKRGLEKGYSFHLATEWDDAEKFDDLVFIHNDQNRRKSYRFLQAKHKQNEDNKKIGIGDLLTEDKNGEFRLAKYFVSYLKIKNNQDFADGDLKDFIICTNIDFDLDQDTAQNAVKKLKMQTIKKNKGKEIWVETIDDSDVFFKDGGTRYKVSYNENDITSIVQQEFKVAVEETMEELKKEVKKLQDKSDQDSKKKLGRNQRWQNEFKQITNSKLKDNIKEFFDKLVFAVDQSNEVELGKILETEISKEFKEKFNYIGELGQSVYYEFQNEILDWMKKKEGSFLSEAEVKDFFRKAGQQVSTLSAIKEGVDRIEEKLVKVEQNNKQVEEYIWFNIKSPSQLFTGRKEELNRLHSGLQICKDRMGVISQLSTISGLGGIGKTELARKYAHEYGKEYSNNVIWIDAEKRETIVELFYRLAQDELMISIKNADGERKSIKSIVKEVFGFFSKKKSLFIFDNAEEFKDLSQFLPLNFLTPDANKPDILITSRNREWGKGISIIDLDTLNLNDSIELVKKGLGINDKSQDQQIENLVEKLQHFPLAIRQAIAYIEDKQVTKRPSVSDYLEEYRKKTKKLINYKVFNEIDNDYAKTTFTTWQVTIDRIAIDEQCGQLALKILDIIAYFAHGNIITKMFLSLACGDEKQLESAIRLLIKYSMVNDEQGQNVLSIHRLVQEVTILELKEQQREEEVLREALELIKSSIIAEENISHIISILNYSSRYDKLIDDFYYDSIYEEHKYTPLHLLVQGNKEKAVENVLKNLKCKKYPSKLIKVVNSIDEHGYSPLRLAVENGNLKIVKYLVENGADFNIVDEDGMTPIKFSALRGNVELVKCFIDMGADINAFLHIAAENSTVELVKYLIGEKGADCNVLDENSMTPLHFVAENGNLELVTYLINHNARVNIRDRYGLSPLHYAAKNGNLRIVKYLVENDANYNVLNQDKKTALDLASDNKHYEVVQYLKIVSNKKSSSNTNQEERHISYEPEEERHISYEPEEERHISYEPEEERHISYEPEEERHISYEPEEERHISYEPEEERHISYEPEEERHISYEPEEERHISYEPEEERHISYEPEEERHISYEPEEERHISYEPEEERHISYEPEEEGTIDRCLPSSGYRRKREIENECLFTWEDVDEFNEAKDEKRNFGKIKINSEKFVDYIKDLSEEKRSQLIGLADQVEVTGKSQGLIHKLTNNIRVMSHLAKVGKISGMSMHGMMAKNVLADFLNGNYQGVAINVGFIAGGQGFAKVAEAASIKGLKLASEGKLLLGRSLKAASPFLARGTSAFVVYDIVNQVKAFKNGTEEALVGVIGDSIYLGVDAAEIGIEIAEAFEVLEGVSSITGPIGATIGAVVFVGTDIYTAVKKVDKIDQIIHLNGDERLIEGLRAFMGMQPEQYIEKLIEKKQVSNQLVNQGLEYLKQHSDIEGYVFPTGELVVDSDQKVSHRLQMDLDNLALLGNTVDNVIWHKAKPDNPNIGKLFCLPTGPIRSSIGGENAYLCHNAIGLSYLDDRTGNSTLIALGKGKDQATGFRDSPNIFLVDDGDKDFTGGDKDDVFILVGNKTIGTLDGSNGNNTLNLAGFALDRDYIDVKFKLSSHYGSIFSPSDIVIKNIHKIYGRKGKQDIIDYGCDIRYVDGQGGKSNDSPDHIIIPYCYSVNRKKIIVRPSTKIDNSDESRHGIFDYIILPDEGKANINIKYDYAFTQQRKHNFLFNYTLFDLASVNIENVKDINYWYAGYGKMTHAIRNVTFSFLSPALKGKSIHEKFDITISDIPANASYIIGNNAEIKIGNKGNLYILENTNQPVDEVINSYLTMANRLKKISFFIQSRNETIVIGSGNHEVIYNNPLYKSHLVGNGGENIYVIDSESEGFEINKLSLPEVVVYDLDAESSVDTIDLRNLVQQARSKLSNKDSFELKVLKSESDLLLKATVIEAEPTEDSSVSKIRKHEYFTVRLKDGVNWYNKTHVIVDNFPVKISLDNNEWSLRPQPLVFEKDKRVIIVTGRDVEENTELIIPRKGGNYTFVREHGTDLIITNVFDANITQEDLCTITLSGFYEELKMETLSIKFADKEIVLKDHREEISTARDMNIVKKEHSEQVYNDVFNHAKSESEVVLVDQVAHKHRHEHSRHRIRNRRSESIISSSTRPSSWINDLFGWVKSSIGGLLGSRTALPEKTFTQSSISQISAPIDVNGTIMLLDLLIRKVTGQKYISTVGQSISPLEAQGYALNITKEFEKVVEQAGLKSGVSMHRLNIDYMGMQKEITRKVMSGKFNEISGILKSYVEKACPDEEAGKLSPKKFEKFIAQFNKGLLNQSIEQILHNRDGRLEVDDAKQMSLEPQSYLSNASVHSHSKVSTCLSEIGVTKLGVNLNR